MAKRQPTEHERLLIARCCELTVEALWGEVCEAENSRSLKHAKGLISGIAYVQATSVKRTFAAEHQGYEATIAGVQAFLYDLLSSVTAMQYRLSLVNIKDDDEVTDRLREYWAYVRESTLLVIKATLACDDGVSNANC